MKQLPQTIHGKPRPLLKCPQNETIAIYINRQICFPMSC